mmetsp:Transcript_1996/g.4332  ORF Transcript_1996/g.4332 Transcript_1996/m.4332 type:complete len:424 (-) Transcript_1996:6-1277(-)
MKSTIFIMKSTMYNIICRIQNMNFWWAPALHVLEIVHVLRQRKQFAPEHPERAGENLLRIHTAGALQVEQEDVVGRHHGHEIRILRTPLKRLLEHLKVLREGGDFVKIFRHAHLPRGLVYREYSVGTDVHQLLTLFDRKRRYLLLIERDDGPETVGGDGHRTPLGVLLRYPDPRNRVQAQRLPRTDLDDGNPLVVTYVVLLHAHKVRGGDVLVVRDELLRRDRQREGAVGQAPGVLPVPLGHARRLHLLLVVHVQGELDGAPVASVRARALPVVHEGSDGVHATRLSRGRASGPLSARRAGVPDRYEAQSVRQIFVLELRVVQGEFDEVDGDGWNLRDHYAAKGVGDGDVGFGEYEVHLVGTEIRYLDLRKALMWHRGRFLLLRRGAVVTGRDRVLFLIGRSGGPTMQERRGYREASMITYCF